MKITDEIITKELFEVEITLEKLLQIIAEELRRSDYHIYGNRPYLDIEEDCGDVVRVELVAEDIHSKDIFTPHFRQRLQTAITTYKGDTDETND